MPKKGRTETIDITLTDERIKELLAVKEKEVTPWRILKIQSEFVQGFDFISRYKNTVSIFGSARCGEKHKLYQKAYRLAYNLSKKGYTIVTGGGPGVMQAANHGAYDAGGKSVGINIQLPQEQRVNKYVRESESFHYFFTRKVILSFASQAYAFFPGGFGTLDEFFEMITLVQTKKKRPLPIVLVHKKYWNPLINWINTDVYQKFSAISPADKHIYHLVDGAREAANFIIKKRKRK
ncbi:TIGR00730 family Rossman fold protein [Patescibacteria group bacterium]